LQDLCVANISSTLKLNGFPCKDAASVTSLDFFSQGLAMRPMPGLTNNTFGSLVTGANEPLTYVGFLTTANKLISQSLKKGDVFAFPKGLVHFQKNNGHVHASVIAAINSQLPGTQSLGATLFGSTTTAPDNILSQAFQTSPGTVKHIKSMFQPKN
ncbi:unnamed protein product, partial [Arabidopsis halleri]